MQVEPERLHADELFRAHGAFVARFLRHLGVPASQVDDLVQEVFLVVHRRGGFVVGEARPTTWLASIAFNMARRERRDIVRRTREQADNDTLLDAPDPRENQEHSAEVNEELAKVECALSRLDFEDRALFVLYEIEEESCEAIAAMFEVKLGTIHSRLHRMRAAFRRAYAWQTTPATKGAAR